MYCETCGRVLLWHTAPGKRETSYCRKCNPPKTTVLEPTGPRSHDITPKDLSAGIKKDMLDIVSSNGVKSAVDPKRLEQEVKDSRNDRRAAIRATRRKNDVLKEAEADAE